MERYKLYENNIYMVWEVTDKKDVLLLHMSSMPFEENKIEKKDMEGFNMFEINISGQDRPLERHGIKYTVTSPGYRMKYVSHNTVKNEFGKLLTITAKDAQTGIEATAFYQFYNKIAVVNSHVLVTNTKREVQTLEYVASFKLCGIEKEGILPRDKKISVDIIHNSWQRELQLKEYSLSDLGIEQSQADNASRSSKAISVDNKGNWSTKEYLPMGLINNKETKSSMIWQIENNGSWHWEISDENCHLYLQLSGPTENESHWFKNLKRGESFESVPVAVGFSRGGMEGCVKELTAYRRVVRRKNADNEKLGVIFNDYMNCLWSDPTTEKELPLIDAAANAGCEYYCIDAGWYADDYWWDDVGLWKPCERRFPGGIKKLISHIRDKGMIPGLWLELEVMGKKCELTKTFPEECFFMRHGKKVYDRSRYQLDFRHPKVIKHANAVVKRLVEDYGVGYIKMDYNLEPGIGTEVDSDSIGNGLLEHERAYLSWIDDIFKKYPDLIIENCSSGGLRMDYAMLRRHSIQSVSDQEDYRHFASIAANSPLGVTMEQAAIWSYPMTKGDREETIFNMVNAILLRIHQSGHLANLSDERCALVKEAISWYKTVRNDIKRSYPFWPIGFSSFEDDWSCLGLRYKNKAYLAVWRRGGDRYKELPIEAFKGKKCTLKCAYPKSAKLNSKNEAERSNYLWNEESGFLSVMIPNAPAARIFELKY